MSLQPYISPKLEKQLSLGFTRGSTYVFHPYTYDPKTKRYGVVTGIRQWIWWFNCTCAYIHYAFIIIRLIQVEFDPTISPEELVTWEYNAVFWAFPIFFQLSFHFGELGISAFTNTYLDFFTNFSPYAKTAYYSSETKMRETWIAEMVLDSVFRSLRFSVSTYVILAIVRPETPGLVTCMMTNPWEKSFSNIVLRILGTVAEIHQSFMYNTQAFLIIFPPTVFNFAMLPAIDHIKDPERETPDLDADIRWFTQMRLLVSYFNSFYGVLIWPQTEVLLIVLSVYGVYAATKWSGVIAIFVCSIAIFCYIWVTVLFKTLGEYCKRSEDLLAKWSQTPGIDKRIFKTLRPLHVKLMESYVDPPLVLTVTEIIIDNSITVLLL